MLQCFSICLFGPVENVCEGVFSVSQCYELYSRGPCPAGHYLAFNYTTETPECKCQEGFVFNEEDGACYELNTPGPCINMKECDAGTPCFMRSMDTLQTECR